MIDYRQLFDLEAKDTINNLIKTFNADRKAFGCPSPMPSSRCTIGIEVEVKWRDFFPQLWKKYFKKGQRKFSDLTEEEQKQLSEDCALLEKSLIPRLEKTIECGIPRGSDRYWEFAFKPVSNVHYVIDQIEILRSKNLIPQKGRHSLHITIGGLRTTRSVYYMLHILELFYVDKHRIAEGFNKDNEKLSSAWARKGYGGVFEKGAHELLNVSTAVELRSLYLPSEYHDLVSMLKLVQEISSIIYDKQSGRTTPMTEKWDRLVENLSGNIQSLGMEDVNWKKPNLDPTNWNLFIEHFDELRSMAVDDWTEFKHSVESSNTLKEIERLTHELNRDELFSLQSFIERRLA